jgi:DNA-binding Xre family transcriptional regulator
MIKEVGLQNRADLSTDLYVTKFSASENYIENFIDFTKVLHQSEAMQCEFVKELINKNRINQNNVMRLKPFIEGLQDNELALDLIDNLSRKGMLVNEKDTLSLVKNRSQKQYAFLTEIVGDKDLSDCISEAGIATLKATFGDDLKVGDQSINVSDLISYYDLKNQTPTLFSMLKPEFKQQLRDNFTPSAQILLYKSAELDMLNSLLREEGKVFDVKISFVENEKLCDYLEKKVGDISEIDHAKTYQINFENFGIEEGKKAEINTLFNNLLKSDNPNEAGVAKFFSDLFGIALSGDDGENLTIFFQQNKKELAHCFCNENLPKENFESLLTTLRDGCFANIGAQFKKMLYATMIKDEEAQILYAVADDKIFSGIINNHGSDIMVGNFSPINNVIINSYLLSPMALVKIISEQEMLTNSKTWEIIQKNLGDDERGKIMERLVEKYPETSEFNQKAKEIVSFLMIKNVVGEVKMTDLESKNPQLKELGDLVCRSPEPSPRSTRGATSEELSGPSPNRSRT